jgi:hypothetical protein
MIIESNEPKKSLEQKSRTKGDKKLKTPTKKVDLYYDNADLLQIFNISPSTLRRYRISGYFKYIKIGGKYFYPVKYIKRLAETGIQPKKAM